MKTHATTFLLAATLALVGLRPVSSSPQLKFSGRELLDSGGAAFNSAFGDINEDGRPDLVISNYSSFGFTTHFGNGEGNFTGSVFKATPGRPWSVAVADLDRDEHLDVAVVVDLNQLLVYFGNGNGVFLDPITYATGIAPFSVRPGQLNRQVDDFVDLVVSNSGDGTLSVFYGDGQGGLTNGMGAFGVPRVFSVGQGPSHFVIGEMNHDLNQDLVVVNTNDVNNDVNILLGDGFGGFSVASTLTAGSRTTGVTSGDFDRDGNLDLAVSNQNTPSVTLYFGSGNGGIRSTASFTVAPLPYDVLAEDADGDGSVDLLVPSGANPPSVTLYRGDGQGFFQPSEVFRCQTAPVDLEVTDLDEDGKNDLVVCHNHPWENVNLFMGKMGGSYAGKSTLDVGDFEAATLIADFNRDGDLDLATTNFRNNDVAISLADGVGGFQPAQTFPTDFGPTVLRTGHLDGDGFLDLAVLAYNSGRVTILLGDGNGSFLPTGQSLVTGSDPRQIRLADLDDDGNQDLVLVNLGNNNLSLFYGDGAGSFSAPVSYGTATWPTAVVAEDFDGDGRKDLAVSCDLNDEVDVLVQDSGGTFSSVGTFGRSQRIATPSQIEIGDFNRDGAQDLVVANDFGGIDSCTVLFGDGSGRFLTGTDVTMGPNQRGIVVGDFDEDGFLDLAGCLHERSLVAVVRGDGMGGFSDLQKFGTEYGPRTLAAGDLNEDGHLDLVVANGDFQVSILHNRTFGEASVYAAKRGTVNAGLGPVTDILFINGSQGGSTRTVEVEAGQPIWGVILPPPGGSNLRYVVQANYGRPSLTTLQTLPSGIGLACFPMLGGTPGAVWNNIGFEHLVGVSQTFGSPIPDPGLAPTIFFYQGTGDSVNLPSGTTLTFQALVHDFGSASPTQNGSVSNAVVVKVL